MWKTHVSWLHPYSAKDCCGAQHALEWDECTWCYRCTSSMPGNPPTSSIPNPKIMRNFFYQIRCVHHWFGLWFEVLAVYRFLISHTSLEKPEAWNIQAKPLSSPLWTMMGSSKSWLQEQIWSLDLPSPTKSYLPKEKTEQLKNKDYSGRLKVKAQQTFPSQGGIYLLGDILDSGKQIDKSCLLLTLENRRF